MFILHLLITPLYDQGLFFYILLLKKGILPNGYGVLGYPYLSEIQIEGSPDISKYSPDDKYGFRFFYKYGDKFWDILRGVMHDTVIVLQGDPEELLVISDKLFYEVVGN